MGESESKNPGEAALAVFILVLKIERSVLEYIANVARCIEGQDFPPMRGVSFIGCNNEVVSKFEGYIQIADKYISQIEGLTTYKHYLQVFEAMHSLFYAELAEILKRARRELDDKSSISKSVINHFFLEERIDQTIEELHQQFSELKQLNGMTKKASQKRIDKFRFFRYPDAHSKMKTFERKVQSCYAKYPDAQDQGLFELSLERATMFITIDQPKYDQLQNSILQAILDREGDMSSRSFTDDEIKIIELMEYLTAHLHFVPTLVAILERLDMCASKYKLLLWHMQRAAHHRHHRHHHEEEEDDDYDDGEDEDEDGVVDDGDPPSVLVKSDFSNRVLQILTPTTQKLIQVGTVGLSKYTNYLLAVKFLVQWQELADTFISRIRLPNATVLSEAEDLIKLHGLSNNYLDDLSAVVRLMTDRQHANNDTNKIMGKNREEFEHLDETLKQDTFRILEEAKILDLQNRMVNCKLLKFRAHQSVA
ncbi:uncharacterized protein LODBEIA_P55680 [Lodderomyces beijingensis]|uniref:Uncharacterized protein n=1 Tax=Lodderomyces beijingensis TaxID=1775926 RepID=A0ABP0ZTX4_9ASCO